MSGLFDYFRRKPARLPEWNFKGPDRTTEEQFLMSFCEDYFHWNDIAWQRYEAHPEPRDITVMKHAEEAYARFITPFIAEETKLQLIAFGSRSTFDPDKVMFLETTSIDDRVTIKFVVDHGPYAQNEYVADMESDPVLSLQQIYYIDPYPENGVDRLPSL